MKIPYGNCDFASIRRGGMFYADKTTFLPLLEGEGAGYNYVLFLRPRRFGKSTLLSMFEHYYDLHFRDQFDELFGGLWIHEHPTPERGERLALKLDFSSVTTDAGPDEMRRSFAASVKAGVRAFLARYRDLFPDLARLETSLDSYHDAADLILTLLSMIPGTGRKMHLLIDEYDHFANRLLADGAEGIYESVVRGTGFVRSFYAALKAGTGMRALAQMFITGISPIMLDDLSSGFNILTHISLQARFNTMAGFTRAEVERAVDDLLAAHPHLEEDPRIGDRQRMLATLEEQYDGYRFSKYAPERVFNSDLVLYFLRELENTGKYPEQMLDRNLRTDYGRLRRIATLSGASGPTTRELLRTVLTEESITSRIVDQFGVQTMHEPEQLVSLFYYMGMLTFLPQPQGTITPRLVIPNRVIRELQWEYLAIALKEHEGIWIDTRRLETALEAMAVRGDIEPLVTLFREQVMSKIGVKDQRQFNEGTLKLMLIAYITQSPTFHILSEKELARGYCDLFLAPTEDFSAGQYGWMLEVKYLKTQAKPAEIKRAVLAAHEQLERYASDQTLLPLLTRGKQLKAGALIFVGGKDVLFHPWPPPQKSPRRPAKKKPPTNPITEPQKKPSPRR